MLPRRTDSMRVPTPRSCFREAAAEFIRGTTLGWGRAELAKWLVCHYSPCLVAATTDNGGGRGAVVSARLSLPSERLEEEHIERIVLDARCSVLRLLADLAWPSQAWTIARTMLATGTLVERSVDGRSTWAPVARKRLRLAERVSSLFVADFLATPRDYQNIVLCRHCGELGFSAPILHESWCEKALSVA